MSSNHGKSNPMSGNFNNFDFDLGLNSSRSRPLNEQKKPANSYSSPSTFTTSYASKPGGTANKPSWTHQPAAAGQSQSVRVGSLSGPSWTSSTPAVGSADFGIPKKDPSLFGDLVSSAFGQNKGNSNVPLKDVAPVGKRNVSSKNAVPFGNKSPFSVGDTTSRGSPVGITGNQGSGNSFGSFTTGFGTSGGAGLNINSSGSANKGSSNLGGPPLKSMTRSGIGAGSGLNHDPFGSLVDFRQKGSSNIGLNRETDNKNNDANDAFKDFQEAPKKNSSNDAFKDFQEAPKKNSSPFSSSGFPSRNNSSTGSTAGGSYPNFDDFAFSSSQPKNQPSMPSAGADNFDAFFQTTSGTEKVIKGVSSQQIPFVDDWGMDPMSGGGNDQSGTTELEGLPPPPAGISASTAKNKGQECQKQGQYPDAIKWLSWAVMLFEKAGEDSIEILSCRASCYKEIGENKKAVADCSKVLEKDGANIYVLVQRALLYESMEKYKLGAEDLRTVMKYDPNNRVAKSTIHRLVKMSE